jgi:hypothetical protein
MRSDPRLSRVLAASVLLLGGLGLMLLGGCFLVGVMMLLTGTGFSNQPVGFAWNSGLTLLLMTLYGLAIACFLGSMVLIVISIRGLMRLLRR